MVSTLKSDAFAESDLIFGLGVKNAGEGCEVGDVFVRAGDGRALGRGGRESAVLLALRDDAPVEVIRAIDKVSRFATEFGHFSGPHHDRLIDRFEIHPPDVKVGADGAALGELKTGVDGRESLFKDFSHVGRFIAYRASKILVLGMQ